MDHSKTTVAIQHPGAADLKNQKNDLTSVGKLLEYYRRVSNNQPKAKEAEENSGNLSRS